MSTTRAQWIAWARVQYAKQFSVSIDEVRVEDREDDPDDAEVWAPGCGVVWTRGCVPYETTQRAAGVTRWVIR